MARLFSFAAWFLLTTWSFAADAPVLFIASTPDGIPAKGTLERLDENWSVRLGERTLKSTEWISLRRQDRPIPPNPSDAHLVLTNGDRIRVKADSLSLSKDRLRFTSPLLNDGKATTVPLSQVSLFWWTKPENVENEFVFQRELLSVKRRGDLVLMHNGDRVEGVLSRLDAERLEIESQKKRVRIDLAQVSALIPSADLASPLIPRMPSGRLITSDGSRFFVRTMKKEDSTLRGTTVFGTSFAVELSELVRIGLLDEKSVSLTSLKPSRYQHTPYLGIPWPLGVNSGAGGEELRLGGSVYDRGFGMHSASQVSFLVPPGFRHFEALVGLDDVTGKNGNARVRVLVDGKEKSLGFKGDLKPGDVHYARVEIRGARELTLCVDFGDVGDVGDHVNWVYPRLIR